MKYILILIIFLNMPNANASEDSVELLKALGFTPVHQEIKSFKLYQRTLLFYLFVPLIDRKKHTILVSY